MAARELNQRARDYEAPLKAHGHRDFERTREGLRRWLAPRVEGARDLHVSPIRTPAGTGVANETLLFDARWRADGREVTQAFAARVASADPLYYQANVETQYRMYEALADVPGAPVPRTFGYEADPAYLGAPFFVADRVAGETPPDRPHYTEAGFVFEATPGQRHQLWTEAVMVLARLHRAPVSRFDFLQRPERGATGLEQELSYFRDYLDWAAAGREHPVLEAGYAWLRAHMPPPATSLSWGDARIANIIFRDFHAVAVLDWDGVSLAGPEADLAWWIMMDHPSHELLPGIGGPDELLGLWRSLTGWKTPNIHYYQVFTAFRLGTIVLKLFDQMGANGVLEAEAAAAQGWNSRAVQQLCLLLGLPPVGPITATLPQLRA